MMNEGWVCPTCKVVYAPWVRECSRCGKSTWVFPDIGARPPTMGPSLVECTVQKFYEDPSNKGKAEVIYCACPKCSRHEVAS